MCTSVCGINTSKWQMSNPIVQKQNRKEEQISILKKWHYRVKMRKILPIISKGLQLDNVTSGSYTTFSIKNLTRFYTVLPHHTTCLAGQCSTLLGKWYCDCGVVIPDEELIFYICNVIVKIYWIINHHWSTHHDKAHKK